MEIKIEKWNGHKIRFVWHQDEWWAVLADITSALNLTAKKVRQRLSKDVLSKHPLQTSGGTQEMLIVNEYGIYETIFESRKVEAKEFKRWVFDVIKELRQQTGLEGFQVFRMMDKGHQRKMMEQVSRLKDVETRHYIKANTIANKVTSTKHGFPKMIKKDDMTPEMLRDRQPILEDAVRLMQMRDEYDMDFSISEAVKRKWS